MRRLLLLGANGQIGWELVRSLAPLGGVLALDRSRLDLSRPAEIRQLLRNIKPEVVVNAAAYTAVDRAESEPALAHAINAEAPGVLAEETRRLGALLVHYSTDYVFDGEKETPYSETDAPRPLNVYGRTKLAGEQAIAATCARHLIFRTSWIYANHGTNFLLTILRLAGERPELRVVDDQIGSPTWARAVANYTTLALAQLLSPMTPDSLRERAGGIYHLAAAGATTRSGFARSILIQAEACGLARAVPVHPVRTEEYPLPAIRPHNSRLSCAKFDRTFGITRSAWEADLQQALQERQTQERITLPDSSS